ncbi:MAG: Mov34/MPN/PAD-1 family protein [Vicinamibacteria bacterium]
MTLRLPKSFADAIITQSRAEHPNEACGLLAGTSGEATKLFRMANAERSPVIYRMEPSEQLRVFNEIEDAGLDLVGIYHSHTRSPAYPSATDVAQAYYSEAVYLIVSLQDENQPDLRAFRINEGKVTEIDLELNDS